MSTLVLRPQGRSLFQRSLNACHQCRGVGSPRWHSSVRSGFQALRKKLPPLADKRLRELPDKPARTRFAPSPTGYLHLGSLRTALFNWLIARATGGQFIIRVEDTDRTRIVDDAVERLLADLKWAELNWDEGPDVGGAFGPYEQSKRLDYYKKYTAQLLDDGKAYRCFCTAHDLERHKQQVLDDGGGSAHYPGTCRGISPSQAERRAANGEKHVVRFRSEGRPSFIDQVYGNYQKNEDEDDFILVKSDGYPTYHFANVIDDHLMEITHVIRGAEWLISTPKHIALYDAFKWEPPTFAHAGLLCAQNGEKLSKRNHDIDISSYRDKGVLPSALNNWLALLGWSMNEKDLAKGGEVFYTTNELAEKFSLRFTKGNIKTNPDKLAVFQRKHLTHRLREENPDEELLKQAFLPPTEKLLAHIASLLPSSSTGSSPENTQPTSEPSTATTPEILTSPTNPKHFFSTADFTSLTPCLSSLSTSATHLLEIYRTLAADSPIDPLDLIYEHPSFFLRPSAHAYVRALENLSLPDTTTPPPVLLADLHASLRDIHELDWNADRLQSVINDFSTRHAASVDPEKPARPINKATYALLRLVLTGDHSRGAKPAKLQLALLGRAETLTRFELCAEQ
ncbi:glutamyl-tRNA synthetase [Colletotrichum higginsianum]|uniref:Glutamate--tRNA ligase, mitochondrial n=1 Tax=Colletotrichum higginsianum (strain IMI 349063) TaxID=759273 RepID=H1UYH8_COLHI|nr:Glutamyl-tRNA synthetase [Colletotrichum higginsianum IMI 349063]OBR13259.1 Glutamyl-tRNA synthetase [Colletotrichum higginsianum IMI 349063]CCF33029.1 glutamyl-tRNA synthetase [Colletotrichum higginsianum]